MNVAYDQFSLWNIVKSEYTEVGGNEELPLGKEFQEHMAVFTQPSLDATVKYSMAKKLIDQLEWVL